MLGTVKDRHCAQVCRSPSPKKIKSFFQIFFTSSIPSPQSRTSPEKSISRFFRPWVQCWSFTVNKSQLSRSIQQGSISSLGSHYHTRSSRCDFEIFQNPIKPSMCLNIWGENGCRFFVWQHCKHGKAIVRFLRFF